LLRSYYSKAKAYQNKKDRDKLKRDLLKEMKSETFQKFSEYIHEYIQGKSQSHLKKIILLIKNVVNSLSSKEQYLTGLSLKEAEGRLIIK
jgi:predicted house-cleaning noncanonical NTP pyrophosphatase (MazG superfamily)